MLIYVPGIYHYTTRSLHFPPDNQDKPAGPMRCDLDVPHKCGGKTKEPMAPPHILLVLTGEKKNKQREGKEGGRGRGWGA